jgi:WD40-like Beta Propeller Repeat
VVATVGANGKVSIYHDAGNLHLIVDVNGWFPTDSGYTGLTPARVLDTRASTAIGANATIDLKVGGNGGVPATGVSAVVLNVTATGGTDETFLTVYPKGVARPNASSLNVLRGQTVPNLVVAPVSADGSISIFNSVGSVNAIVDVAGWFGGTSFSALTPSRILDTRTPSSRLGADSKIDLQVTGVGGVPATGVGSVVLNVTAVAPSATTYVTVWPAGVTRPIASSLNAEAGQIVPNAVVANVGAGGKVSLYNFAGTTDLLVDVAGWFPGATAPPDPNPNPTPTPGNEILLSNSDGFVRWNLTTRKQTIIDNVAAGVRYQAILPLNEYLYDDRSENIVIRDLTTRALKANFKWPRTQTGLIPDYLSTYPTPSPNGQYFMAGVVAIDGVAPSDTVMLVNRAGVAVRYFTKKVYDWAWEPNGDLLVAFDSKSLNNGTIAELYRIPATQIAAGTFQTTLIRTFGGLSAPGNFVVSPDGQKIAYTVDGQLWTAPLVANFVGKQLTYGAEAALNFSFSPDSSRIAFLYMSYYGLYSSRGGYMNIIPWTLPAPIEISDDDATEFKTDTGARKLITCCLYWR